MPRSTVSPIPSRRCWVQTKCFYYHSRRQPVLYKDCGKSSPSSTNEAHRNQASLCSRSGQTRSDQTGVLFNTGPRDSSSNEAPRPRKSSETPEGNSGTLDNYSLVINNYLC